MQIELKVRRHPSGNYTLTERTQTQMQAEDCDGPLFVNSDAASFYKAVAAKLAQLHAAGHEISYQDV